MRIGFLIYLYDHIYYNHPDKDKVFKLPEGFDIYDLYALYYGTVKCGGRYGGQAMPCTGR